MEIFQIVGHLGAAPKLSDKDGKFRTQLRVAVNGRRDEPNWYWVTVFGKQAKACAEHLGTGACVAVSGRLQPGVYKERVTMDLIAGSVDFITTGRKDDDAAEPEAEDEIPF